MKFIKKRLARFRQNTAENTAENRDIIKRYIDLDFYNQNEKKQYKTQHEAASAYLKKGEFAVRSPAAWFDTQYYLTHNPDIKRHGQSPFLHYIKFGHAEGRKAHATLSPAEELAHIPQAILDVIRPDFDENFYIKQYPKIKNTAIDPVCHYVLYGEQFGASPNTWFNAKVYQRLNHFYPLQQTCFFHHYLTYGKALGWLECEDRETQFGRAIKEQENAPVVFVKAPVSNMKSRGLQNLLHYPAQPKLPKSIEEKPIGDSHFINSNRLDIHWILARFAKGSGGAMTIFRMVKWLELFGHKCTIWIEDPVHYVSPEHAKQDINAYFQTVKAEVKFVSQELREATGDAVIATAWETASLASHVTGFKERFYFVQDHECEFHATGSLNIAARMSYDLDLACICAGPWLEDLMNGYGRWARSFQLAIDESYYFPAEKNAQNKAHKPLRIAFYARQETKRRGVELGIVALEALAKKGIEFRVDFFGQDLDFEHAPFEAVSHGILTPRELGELYRQCDLGMVFSCTNYSLIPQEMMACNLPIVEIDMPSTRGVYPEGVVCYTGPHPLHIAESIEALIDDKQRRENLAQAGKNWSEQFSWEKSARLVESAIVEKITNKPSYRLEQELPALKVTQNESAKVTVCILANHAGELLPNILQAVKKQRTPWKFQILVMNCGSDDANLERMLENNEIILKQAPLSAVSMAQIKNHVFEIAETEYVAFLHQHAKPVDPWWLYNLVTTLDAFPQAHAVFGRIVSGTEEHDAPAKEQRKDDFKQLQSWPLLSHRAIEILQWNSQNSDYLEKICFYNDANSCLRTSILKEYPYPEVKQEEDKAWAKMIIEKGLIKAYAPDAVVIELQD